jgi:hypothetical protein
MCSKELLLKPETVHSWAGGIQRPIPTYENVCVCANEEREGENDAQREERGKEAKGERMIKGE